jgi:hypothetical protein
MRNLPRLWISRRCYGLRQRGRIKADPLVGNQLSHQAGTISGRSLGKLRDDRGIQVRMCCNFVVESKAGVDDRHFSSSPRTDRA